MMEGVAVPTEWASLYGVVVEEEPRMKAVTVCHWLALFLFLILVPRGMESASSR